MKIISDLHIHSKYSRATSEDMSIPSITRFARIKGLNLVGTGDFTHPKWFEELREHLIPIPEINLYKPAQPPEAPVYYMITAEVSTIFEFQGQVKKIHHIILVPNLEVAAQVNDTLAKYGDLAVDGRPTLNLSAPELVDEVMSISMDNEIIPSHAWTPWFSIFGAFSGFDSVDDCYQDMTRHIHAIETGLSCYDEKTEVLTDNGWKKFSEIRYSDKICTLNLKTDQIEFQNPIGIFKYKYQGKMYRLKTRKVDLFVTPNHKLLVSPCDFRNPKPFSLKEAILV
ncbi:MAG: endonuclease Q family protein [Candidatus Bathyarchaeia archaeon]